MCDKVGSGRWRRPANGAHLSNCPRSRWSPLPSLRSVSAHNLLAICGRGVAKRGNLVGLHRRQIRVSTSHPLVRRSSIFLFFAASSSSAGAFFFYFAFNSTSLRQFVSKSIISLPFFVSCLSRDLFVDTFLLFLWVSMLSVPRGHDRRDVPLIVLLFRSEGVPC